MTWTLLTAMQAAPVAELLDQAIGSYTAEHKEFYDRT